MDTPETDLEVRLAEFLGDDLGGGVGIQKAVAQDLANDLVGAAVRGFRTGLLRQEGGQALLLEAVQQLIIALPAAAVFFGDGGDVVCQTLALDEHQEAVGLQVGGRDGQGARGTDQTVGAGVEMERRRAHGERIVKTLGNV
jgi:hypothetical protein